MPDYRGMQFNNTFRGCEPTDFNACVGNNGQPSYTEYANGFADAAVDLIDIAIRDHSMDELVYPICFNMRHAIELRLKQFVFKLEYIRNTINLGDFQDTKMHDLGEIWRYYKTKSGDVDHRIVEKLEEIELIILNFAEIDPTGQTFRYPYSTGNIKHLTNVSLINLVHLKTEFEILQSSLEEIHHFTNSLVDEYGTGTYTNNLSRFDIKNIAQKLPPHTQWTSNLESCLEIKSLIRKEYSISSGEFGQAKRLIESHYEFAKEIDLEVPLQHSTATDWIAIFHAYNAKNLANKASEKNSSNYSFKPDLEGFISRAQALNEAMNYCIDNISIESFIDIFCVYECGRNGNYCEYYKQFLNTEIQLVKIHAQDIEERKEYIRYLLSKSNFEKFSLKGLRMLEQGEILGALSLKYDFEF